MGLFRVFNRRVFSITAVMLLGTALLACQSGGVGFGLPDPAPTEPPAQELPEAKGEIIGNGDVRVALLLPLSAPGNAAKIAGELKNAASMAMEDWGMQSLQLVIKDTLGTPNGAVDAASEASAEGASLVLGPLFAGNVTAVTGVLRPAGKTIMAFSSDSRVGGQGVYLSSFLPETIIDRTLTYAVSSGQRDIIAILPNGGIGNLAAAQINKTLPRVGGRLVTTVRYDYNDASVEAAIEALAPSLPEAQAIFIPDGGSTPGAIVNTMRRRGLSLEGKKLLGTGQWASSDLKNPALAGAWFADSDQASIASFKTKYSAKFGTTPSAVAPLAYDAVALVSGIVKRFGATGLTSETIESRTGYSGYTGVFRFLPDGSNERGLAVYEISGDDLRVVSPAPRAFSRGF
ncbi:MAG: penicillin-binding protein activator [Rhizobiaceae bacterium]